MRHAGSRSERKGYSSRGNSEAASIAPYLVFDVPPLDLPPSACEIASFSVFELSLTDLLAAPNVSPPDPTSVTRVVIVTDEIPLQASAAAVQRASSALLR